MFVDGDMLLHPDFIADHARLARRGFYTQGVRVHADAALTRALIAQSGEPAATAGRPASAALRRAYLLHSPVAERRSRAGSPTDSSPSRAATRASGAPTCCASNGFNEAIEGWGPEDKELAARLENAGVRRQTLLFGGIAVHLHHAPASRAALPANLAMLEDTRRQRKTRCERGLDAHFRN